MLLDRQDARPRRCRVYDDESAPLQKLDVLSKGGKDKGSGLGGQYRLRAKLDDARAFDLSRIVRDAPGIWMFVCEALFLATGGMEL